MSDRIDAWQWNAKQICGDCRIRLPKASFHGTIDIRDIDIDSQYKTADDIEDLQVRECRVLASALLSSVAGRSADRPASRGWRGRVIVKLRSSMRRYGATPDEVDDVVASAAAANLPLAGYALHLPLAGTEHDRIAEVDAWLDSIDAEEPLWRSRRSWARP